MAAVQLETALDRPTTHPNLARRCSGGSIGRICEGDRDLLAVEVDAASLLPPDDSSHGFDDIADVFGVSLLLLEELHDCFLLRS